MTKEEWIEYFELVNDRWPSRLEINHAREVGEIKGEARDVPVDSRPQREREVRTNLDYQQVPFSNRGSGLSQSWSYPRQTYPNPLAQQMAPGPYLTKKSSRKLKLKLWQIITLAISGFVLLCFLGFGGYAAWHYQTGNIEGTWHRVKAKYYDADKDKWTYFDEEDDAKEFDSDDNQDGGEYYLTVHQDKTVQFFGYSFISDDDDDGYDLGDYDSDDNDSDSWESDDYFNDKKDDYDVESYRNTTTRNPSTSDDDYNSDEDYEDSDDYDYDDDDYGYEKVPIISLEDYMAGSYKVSQWNRAIVPAYSRSQYRKKLSSLFDRKFKDYLGSDDDEIIDDMVDTYANYIGRGNDKHSTMAYQVKGDKLILTIRNKTGKMISQLTYEKLNDSQTQDAKETYSQEKEQFEENNAIN